MKRVSGDMARGSKETWWSQHREASLNWLALARTAAGGVECGGQPRGAPQAKRRPESLRGYAYVSVRAQRSAATDR